MPKRLPVAYLLAFEQLAILHFDIVAPMRFIGNICGNLTKDGR